MRGQVRVSFQVGDTGGYGTAGYGYNPSTAVLDSVTSGPQGVSANGDSSGFGNSGNSLYNIDAKWANLLIPVTIRSYTPSPKRPSSSGLTAPQYRGAMQDYRSAPSGTTQTDSYSSLIRKYYGMDRDQRKKLQQDLYDAGYYQGQSKPVIDGTTRDNGFFQGYELSLQHSYLQQKPWDQLIEENKADIAAAGGLDPYGGHSGPLQIVTTNPDDLRQAAMEAGQKLAGENPDEEFINNFIASYHSAEITAQQRKYSQAITGGTVEAPPAQSAAAEAAMREQHPEKVRGHAEAGGVDTLRSLIQSSGSNV